MNTANLEKILSYINWNYLFLFLLLGALLGGLFALVRGVYKTTCKYIVEGILIVILVLTMPYLINVISNLDLSFLHLSFEINKHLINVTSVEDTLINVIDALNLQNSSTSDSSIYLTVIGLAHSLIGLILFFVGMLVIVILTPLFSWIVYLLTFVIFLSKERRKNKKHRIISTIEGMVCGTVIASLFLAPFSSILNISSKAADEINAASKDESGNSTISQSDYQAILNLLSTYNDSAFYSMISFGSNDSSKLLDNKLMQQVTTTSINGVNSSVYNEISILIQIVSSFGDAINISVGENGKISATIDYTKALIPTVIGEFLDKLSSWKMLMYLIPAFVEIGLNKVNIDTYDLNLKNISYQDTVQSIKEIYIQLYNSGLIESYVVPGLENNSFANSFTFSLDKIDEYKKAINAVINSNVFKENIPIILANLVKSQNLNFFSSDIDDYKNINYINSIDNIFEFMVYGLATLDIYSISSNTFNDFLNNLQKSLKEGDKNNQISNLLAGGELTFKQNDKEYKINYSGLFDNELMDGKFFDFAQFFVYLADLDKDIYKLIEKDRLKYAGKKIQEKGLKNEIRSLVDSIGHLLELYSIMTNNNGLLNLRDRKAVNALSNILTSFDKSDVLKELLPVLVKNFLTLNENLENSLFGLKIDDFDFYPKDDKGELIFASEINHIVEILPDILNFKDSLDNKKNAKELLNAIDTKTLKNILTTIASNKVVNPDKYYTSDKIIKNSNLNTFLRGLFKDDNLIKYGFELETNLDNIEYLDIDNKEGEITKLIKVIDFMKSSSIIDLLSKENVDIYMLNPDDIELFFAVISNSKLLSSSLYKILNYNVSPLLMDMGVKVDFYNVKDFEKEGKNFAQAIRLLQTLPSSDFSKVDWFSLDENQVNSLLTSLSTLQTMAVNKNEEGKYVDNFGKVIYKLLLNSNEIKKVFPSLDEEDFSIVKDIYTGEKKEDFSSWTNQIVKGGFSYVNSSNETITVNDVLIDSNGEIYRICKLLNDIGDSHIKDDNFNYKNLPPTTLKSIITNMNHSKVMYKMLPSLLNYTFDNIGEFDIGNNSNTQKINFSLINSESLLLLDVDQRQEDLDLLVEIFTKLVENEQTFKNIGKGFDETQQTVTLTYTEIGEIEDLLNDIAKMKMAQSVRSGKDISFFDDLMSIVFNISGFDKALTGINDSNLAKSVMLPYIKKVSRESNITYKGFQWDFIIPNESNNDEQVTISNKNTSKRTEYILTEKSSQILSLTKLIRYAKKENLSLNNLNGSFITSSNSISSEQFKFILQSINESLIMHFGIPNIFRRIFESMNIYKYLSDDKKVIFNNNLISNRNFDGVLNNNIVNGTNIDYWNNNIVSMTDLYLTLKNNTSNSVNFDYLDFTNLKFASLLNPISNMPLFDNVKEDLIYNLLSKVKFSSVDTTEFNAINYVRSIQNYPEKEGKQLRIYKLLFDEEYSTLEKNEQYEILDEVLNKLEKLSKVDFDSSSVDYDPSSLGQSLKDLIYASFIYKYENSTLTYKRGYFAQELITSLLKEKFQALFDKNSSEYLFFNEFFYKDKEFSKDYLYLNPIEINGLVGLIHLSDVNKYNTSYFKNNNDDFNLLRSDLKLLGRKYPSSNIPSSNEEAFLNEIENDLSLTKYTSTSNKRLVNSQIAINLFNYYSNKVQINDTYTLKQAIDIYNQYVNNYPQLNREKIDFKERSFEESSDDIVYVIKNIDTFSKGL